MITTNIHDVTKIEIRHIERRFGSTWRTISIYYGEDRTDISCFPKNNREENLSVKAKAPNLIAFGPNHHAVIMGEKAFYYSYCSIVAYECWGVRARVQSTSKTTTRHLKTMGVYDFPVLSAGEFADLIG